MEQIYDWAKNLIFGLCLMELFGHLVRKEDYRRYIRFFGGIIILIMVVSPVLGLFSGMDIFDEALKKAVLREEAVNIELAGQTLAELQNTKISEAYQKELERQIREIAEGHNQRVLTVHVGLEEKKGTAAAIESVKMQVAKARNGISVFEADEDTGEKQQQALKEIKTEIASMYSVERGQITISIKE